MSEMGQSEKNSVRAFVFRFALKLGHRSTQRHFAFVPNPEIVDRLTDCTTKRQLHHAVAV
jgi:hypothetical protein